MYPVVAHVDSVPVRAPIVSQAWGRCPSKVLAADVAGASRAVLVALPTLAEPVHLDIRGARVSSAGRTRAEGFVLPTRPSCRGSVAFRRSVWVQLSLPGAREAPSLRGSPAYYVARTPQGWVIWDQVH